jgi:hypothetical protein
MVACSNSSPTKGRRRHTRSSTSVQRHPGISVFVRVIVRTSYHLIYAYGLRERMD